MNHLLPVIAVSIGCTSCLCAFLAFVYVKWCSGKHNIQVGGDGVVPGTKDSKRIKIGPKNDAIVHHSYNNQQNQAPSKSFFLFQNRQPNQQPQHLHDAKTIEMSIPMSQAVMYDVEIGSKAQPNYYLQPHDRQLTPPTDSDSSCASGGSNDNNDDNTSVSFGSFQKCDIVIDKFDDHPRNNNIEEEMNNHKPIHNNNIEAITDKRKEEIIDSQPDMESQHSVTFDMTTNKTYETVKCNPSYFSSDDEDDNYDYDETTSSSFGHKSDNITQDQETIPSMTVPNVEQSLSIPDLDSGDWEISCSSEDRSEIQTPVNLNNKSNNIKEENHPRQIQYLKPEETIESCTFCHEEYDLSECVRFSYNEKCKHLMCINCCEQGKFAELNGKCPECCSSKLAVGKPPRAGQSFEPLQEMVIMSI